jgi:hypothetical protein
MKQAAKWDELDSGCAAIAVIGAVATVAAVAVTALFLLRNASWLQIQANTRRPRSPSPSPLPSPSPWPSPWPSPPPDFLQMARPSTNDSRLVPCNKVRTRSQCTLEVHQDIAILHTSLHVDRPISSNFLFSVFLLLSPFFLLSRMSDKPCNGNNLFFFLFHF